MVILLLLIVALTGPLVTSAETLKVSVKHSSGTPLSGAMILILWDRAGNSAGLKSNIGIETDLSIRTKEDGSFTTDLPPGFYDVFVAAPAFTPTSRKIRMKVGEVQEITLHLDPDALYTAEMDDLAAEVSDVFDHVTPGYVPEGKATRRQGVASAEQCQSICAPTLTCKAYAFDTGTAACYFYSEVFMGGTPGTRRMGMYSSGLSILPKAGFISAFRRSSYPPPPVFQRQK